MKILLIPVFVFFVLSSSAQGDIEMRKTRFVYEGKVIKPRQVLELMKSDEQAYPVFQKAMANYNAAQVLGFVGGFLVGWPLGTAIGGGDPNWGLAAGGGALILVSIPLSVSFKKHAETAVSIYNGKPMALRPAFRISPWGMGAKVTMKF
jgi:hypothetical protein